VTQLRAYFWVFLIAASVASSAALYFQVRSNGELNQSAAQMEKTIEAQERNIVAIMSVVSDQQEAVAEAQREAEAISLKAKEAAHDLQIVLKEPETAECADTRLSGGMRQWVRGYQAGNDQG
jgi:hypothetical protein